MKQRILNFALMTSLLTSSLAFSQDKAQTSEPERQASTVPVEAQAASVAPAPAASDPIKATELDPSLVNAKKGAGFVDKIRADSFINSLTSTSRDTGKTKTATKNGLRMVLDIRLPIIFESCDLAINHEMLRLAYAYVTDLPGAENQLKSVADAIVRKKGDDIQGVSPNCRAALKGFSIAVLRVYLGGEWNERDEEKLQNARKEP